MKHISNSTAMAAWLALLALTALSLLLGGYVGHAAWMPLLVAVIVWTKGTMVARYFIESGTVHPFIAWVMRAFIALTPLALLLSTVLGK